VDLTIRRLSKDLERGTVDRDLLDQLGWTEDELKSFVNRMQEQLAERQQNQQADKERSLSQKSFDEMLRSLDLNSTGETRTGRTDRQLEQTDTTIRRSPPPAKYREWQKMYERSLNKQTE